MTDKLKVLETREKVVELFNQGLSRSQIAKELDISVPYVSKILNVRGLGETYLDKQEVVAKIAKAVELVHKGYSKQEAAKLVGTDNSSLAMYACRFRQEIKEVLRKRHSEASVDDVFPDRYGTNLKTSKRKETKMPDTTPPQQPQEVKPLEIRRPEPIPLQPVEQQVQPEPSKDTPPISFNSRASKIQALNTEVVNCAVATLYYLALTIGISVVLLSAEVLKAKLTSSLLFGLSIGVLVIMAISSLVRLFKSAKGFLDAKKELKQLKEGV